MNHIGKDTEIQVGDRKFVLSRYTRNINEEWLAWARDQLPERPRFDYAEAKELIKDLPANLQELVIKDTLEQARQERAEQEAGDARKIEELRTSPAGVYKLFGLLLRKHHPALSQADIEKLYDDLEAQHGYDYLARKVAECAGVTEQEYQSLEQQWLRKAGLLPSQEATFRPQEAVGPTR